MTTALNQDQHVDKAAVSRPQRRASFARNALSDVKMSWKMALILSLTILSMLGMAAAGAQGLEVMRYHVSNIYDFMLVPIEAINQAESALADVQYRLEVLKDPTLSGAEQGVNLTAIEANTQKVADVITRYDTEWVTTLSPDFRALLSNAGRLDLQQDETATLAALHKAFDEYRAARDAYLKSLRNKIPDAQLGSATSSALAQTRAQLQHLIEINDSFAQLSDQAAVAAQRQALTLLGVVSGLILILSLALAGLITFSTTSRLGELTRSAELLQTGTALVAVPVTGRDEIGTLARAFDRMAMQARELIGSLEQRVADRTAQLRTSADVGRAAASILDTDQLLRQTVKLITDRFGFYYAAMFTLDATGKWAELREGSGEAGRILKERRHRLEVNSQSMVGAAIRTLNSQIALRISEDTTRFANPLLPDTQSEIALPLVAGNRVLGALDVQSTVPDAFDESSAAVLQAMADQIAIALSNSAQFEQTQVALRRTERLYEASLAIAGAKNTQGALEALLAHAAPDADLGLIITYGGQGQTGRWTYLEVSASWLRGTEVPAIAIGTRYAAEQFPFVNSITPTQPLIAPNLAEFNADVDVRNALKALEVDAAVGLALTAGSVPIGVLLIAYREPRPLAATDVRSLQTLAGQAASLMHNQRLTQETQQALKQLDELNRRLTGETWQVYSRTTAHTLHQMDLAPGVAIDRTTGPLPARLTTPVMLHNEIIGMLGLEDLTPERAWTPDDLALLEAVANELAIAIENQRLIEETEKRAQRERLVAEISSRMFAQNDLESIVEIAATELGRVLHLNRAEVRIEAKPLAMATPQVDSQAQEAQA